jgi:WhiB family redox-sensing transcriptional regulator
MNFSTISKPTTRGAARITHIKESPMATYGLSTIEVPVPDIDVLAPISPREPGRDPDLIRSDDEFTDDSLAVRAPVARCADGNGTMVGLFFSDHVVDVARAKAMCGLCPLQIECLNMALENEEPWGVWGGELLSGGRIVTNKRPCGRPPKNPRPEIVYDEMGPVGVVA